MKRLNLNLKPWPWLPWYQRRWVHVPISIVLLMLSLAMMFVFSIVHHENWMIPGFVTLLWAGWHFYYRPDGRWRG